MSEPAVRRHSTPSLPRPSTRVALPRARRRSLSRLCIGAARSNTSRFRPAWVPGIRASRKPTWVVCVAPVTARPCSASKRACRAVSALSLPAARANRNIAPARARAGFRPARPRQEGPPPNCQHDDRRSAASGAVPTFRSEGFMKRLVLLLATLLFSVFALAAVNINTATKEELDALPGIGPVKAQAIVDYRTKNGPFKTPEDIMKVSGIKEGEFSKLKGLISVSGASTPVAAPAKAETKAAAPAAAPATPAVAPA